MSFSPPQVLAGLRGEFFKEVSMKSWRTVLLYGLLFLFFLQLLTDFVAAIYAFGLLGTSIPPEMGFVVLFFSPVLLLALRRPGPRLMSILFLLIMLARLVEPLLPTYGRMLFAGLGVAFWLMFFPLLLWREAQVSREGLPMSMTAGLLLATLLSAGFRAWGMGEDASLVGWGQMVGVGLAWIGGWLWWKGEFMQMPERAESPIASASGVTGLVLGLMAGWMLVYFAFSAPYVMARWTGVDAWWVLGVMLAAWVVWAWVWSRAGGRLTHQRVHMIGLTLFVVMLFAAIQGFIPYFPNDPTGYPLPGKVENRGVFVPFFIMLMLSPLLFVGIQHLFAAILARRPSLRQLAGSFTLASAFLLLAILAHIFTTTYDYIPVIGLLFRDRFAWVYLMVGLVFLMGVATAMRSSRLVEPGHLSWWAVGFSVLALLILLMHGITTPHLQPPPAQDTITILTYNIQQGYSADGQKNYAGQLAQIQALQPDIIGLAECDTARIANSNDDVVRYFADHLGMYSYYGPRTVAGTFGIALLSRYPILEQETYYLYSEGEQVAAIVAMVDVGDQNWRILVTHLGNGGPMIQQKEFLELVGKAPRRTIAMGDFNFRPDTPQYALTTQVLRDSWTVRWPDWQDDLGQKPDTKIDHIFISPDLSVVDAQYAPKGPSDHPAVTATLVR